MHINDGTVVFDRKRCYCNGGTKPRPIPCPTCRGTGNGPRGGKGGCRKCHGFGKDYDRNDPVTCDRCHGTMVRDELEDAYDFMPSGMFGQLGIPVRVVRQDRALSWNESYLGLGCVWSCTDYGEAWKANDDASLAAKVADDLDKRGHQLCHLLADSHDATTLARWVGVFVAPGGYSVRAIHQDGPAYVASVPQDVSRAIGEAVYANGGHGTMAAALASDRLMEGN